MSKQPFPNLSTRVVDDTGIVTPPWRAFFKALWDLTQGSGANVLYSEDGLSVPLNRNGGAGTLIDNLAPGLLAPGSLEAINGNQAYALKQVSAQALQEAALAYQIASGLNEDNIPDGPVNYFKTRSQYVDNGLAVLPTFGLNKLFNNSFEINSVTPSGTACSQVGQMPSDGWTITQSDVDPVTGKYYWSVQTITNIGVNAGTCLVFTPTPGTTLPYAYNAVATMRLQSVPMAASAANLVVSNWVKTTSAMTDGTTFSNAISLENLVSAMGINNPQDTNGLYYFLNFSDFEGGGANPTVWTQVNQLDSHNNNVISINYPLFKIEVAVQFTNLNVPITMPAVGNLLFVDDIIAQYPIDLSLAGGATQTVTNAAAGSVKTFQSGTASVTTSTTGQVTTNITLGTAVNTVKAQVTLSESSGSATVASSATSGRLTSGTNLELITDVAIGGAANTQSVLWQVLEWN